MMAKAKILANDGISKAGADALIAVGFELSTDFIAQDQLADHINANNIEVLLVRSATKVRQPLIDACPGLKLIGRGGVGVDNIDVEHAKNAGKVVFNTPASSSQSVAELAFGMMFSLARMTYDADRVMPSTGASEFNNLKKKYAKGIELRGRTLGIIGLGRIGKSLASYALGCGMNVIAFDPYCTDFSVSLEIAGNSIKVEVQKADSIDALLAVSNFVSLHVPKQKDGSAVLGTKELAMLPKGSYIVNCARGGVVDEDAMLESLNSGHLAGVALDVFENEPTPRQDLLSHPKIISTPHIGASTNEAQDRIGMEIAEIVMSHYAG